MLVGTDLEIVLAGRSAAIRITVEPIDRFLPLEQQRDLAISGMRAAEKLADVANRLAPELQEIVPRLTT